MARSRVPCEDKRIVASSFLLVLRFDRLLENLSRQNPDSSDVWLFPQFKTDATRNSVLSRWIGMLSTILLLENTSGGSQSLRYETSDQSLSIRT
ncbi:uncharacterized protein LOC112342439 isoform X2 [Selaginella moellendorffii]|uniref:uncharacterized protein LOC112342439 isoform X2 n=1 Tax=Selaginella moellendorffii TaxID=88036 RepID=UPI000D1CBD75|nr:uncharacterized protein LOC112342439 isoform X2 [Selaginella moellendorffii]|eukprot:XP_024520017.1 uncharacterized protein LOC112342439 isoform X2 [Selaginella moellendorffii]